VLPTRKVNISLSCDLHEPTFKQDGGRIDLIDKWLPIKNSFVSIKISPTNLVFELIIQKKCLLSNEVSWANLNTHKKI